MSNLSQAIPILAREDAYVHTVIPGLRFVMESTRYNIRPGKEDGYIEITDTAGNVKHQRFSITDSIFGLERRHYINFGHVVSEVLEDYIEVYGSEGNSFKLFTTENWSLVDGVKLHATLTN